MTEKFIALYTK